MSSLRKGFRRTGLNRLATVGLCFVFSSILATEETLVAARAACRYQVPSSGDDGTNWTAVAFDDSSWDEGHSGLGYDTAATYAALFGTTVPVGTIDIYTRFAFERPANKSYDSLTLRLKYEDGFIAYLNGFEVARGNAPANPAYNSTSTAQRDDNLALAYLDIDISSFLSRLAVGTNVLAVHALNNSSGSTDLLMLPELVAGLPEVITNIAINEFMAVNDSTLKNSLGKYGDWVELYNPNTSSVSLAGWYLTDKAATPTKWQFPLGSASTIAGKGYLLVWTDDKSYSVTNNELHTSFSLNGDGEYLALVKPDGVTVTYAYAPTFPAQYADISFGIGLSGENRYFATPTPGAVNAFEGGSNQVTGVKFSPKRGVYTNAMPQVTVTASTLGSEIRYTTDAEPPTAASALYSAPLTLDHTAVFRAAAFKAGWAPSVIDTHTYISADDALRQTGIPAGYPTNSWITAQYTNAPDYSMNQTVVAAYGLALTNALKALPSLSLVTSVSNLFDQATGIYTHPTSTGTTWERETSVEWTDPDNTSKFQVDCGLQIQGGAFRSFYHTRKKSFSLQFRGLYGTGRLEEDLFSGDAVQSFDDLNLRAGANDAWNTWGHQKTQYIVDEFMRRTHLAMGGLSPHGRFVHLYLNGLYWGVYNATEVVSGESAASYLGGQDDTWDVISQYNEALDGTITAWNAMLNLLPTSGVSNEAYQRVQGNNPNGTRNPAYPIYLDVGNYIDYLVAQYWSANSDWPGNNWRAFRDRNESLSTGFKFAIWDAEASLGVWGDRTTDQTGLATGVAVMQGRLLSNAEYRLRFADRIQKHMFNGGQLTPEVTVPRYTELASMIEPALVAESARWGDQDGNATHTVDQWRTQRDYVLDTFLPQRGANALQYFRNRGLYPTNDAPTFSQFGGVFTNSQTLTMSASTPVYYTTDGSDPREYGTGAVLGALYTNGVTLTRATRVKARARSAATGEWSALTEAVFTPAEKPALRVTELMYHPRKLADGALEALDGDDEFIELQNAGDAPVGLAGLRLTQGVTFDFAGSPVQTLAPGEFLLVVKSLEAFTNRYPSVPAARIAGVFAYPAQSLDDTGEKVELEDAEGRSMASFTYDNAWLVATDGAGHSLVPLPGVAQADGELDYRGNWRASAYIGGSPGAEDPVPPAASLVLNEILAHTDYDDPVYDSNDGIELYNATAASVTLGEGWYLSDDPEDLAKWAIPATNTIVAHGWRYFDEVHDFHSPITNGFGLNKAGDHVLLSYLPGTGLDRVVDAVAFAGEENNVPLMRFPDGSDAWFHGVPTPSSSNQLAETDVQISEVMYHPAPTSSNPENNENDEYVELHNPATHAVTLADLVEGAGTWRLSGGIDFDFPDGTVLPAGGRLAVVPFDPASDAAALGAFLAAYSLTNGQVRLLGPFSGQLNNMTDTVRLERPIAPDDADDDVSWHVVDSVTYYDGDPWTADADGTGFALDRVPGRNDGNLSSSWVAAFGASPGTDTPKFVVNSPAANTGYAAPATIGVSAAVDPIFVVGTVREVVFAIDGLDVASVSNAPYSASVLLDGAEGTRTVTARLTDDEGTFVSAAVPIMLYTNVPAFSGGKDQTINLAVTDHVDLRAIVASLGGSTYPVSFVWSGPNDDTVVIQRPTQGDATASFSQPGQYELTLTLYYGQLVTNLCVTVTVNATNTLNQIPYKEGFEAYELGSTLAGVHGWYCPSAEIALIETNRFAFGSEYRPLPGAHEQSLGYIGSLTNEFSEMTGMTNICIDMLIGVLQGDDNQPTLGSDDQLGFRVNEAQHLAVWHGQSGSSNRWTEITDVTVPTNSFVRLTVMADYAQSPSAVSKFRIWIDRVPVTNPAVWFDSATTNRHYLSGIVFNGEGQVDDLVVDNYNSMLYRRIVASAGANGRVEPSGELLVPVGTSTNIAVSPDAFYRVGSVSVDGLSVGSVSSYEFTNVWDEHTLAADFVAGLTADGVPELWLNRLNPAWVSDFETHALGDLDGDGVPNGEEYSAGTDATNALSVFRINVAISNGTPIVSFPTTPFENDFGLIRVRHYALEQSEDLSSGGWRDVENWSDIVATGRTAVYTNQFEAPVRFFRGRVWLDQ